MGNGYAAAQLGYMYLTGADGVPANNKTAFEYFSKAVEQGVPSGHNGVGLAYLHGAGVERNLHRAAAYFKRAAGADLADAQVNLAVMMLNEQGGLRRDVPEIIKLLQAATHHGHVMAMYYLGAIHQHAIGVRRDCSVANAFYRMVGERSPLMAELLDRALDAHVQHRFNESWIYYLLAAEQGLEVAQANAAWQLDRGLVTPPFPPEDAQRRALTLWRRAAAQGNVNAKVMIGDYYYYGRGVAPDPTLAAQYYSLADNERSARAAFNLGYMYERGIGLEQDYPLAKRYYDRAKELSTEAYLPATLALAHLAAKVAWQALQNWATGAGGASGGPTFATLSGMFGYRAPAPAPERPGSSMSFPRSTSAAAAATDTGAGPADALALWDAESMLLAVAVVACALVLAVRLWWLPRQVAAVQRAAARVPVPGGSPAVRAVNAAVPGANVQVPTLLRDAAAAGGSPSARRAWPHRRPRQRRRRRRAPTPSTPPRAASDRGPCASPRIRSGPSGRTTRRPSAPAKEDCTLRCHRHISAPVQNARMPSHRRRSRQPSIGSLRAAGAAPRWRPPQHRPARTRLPAGSAAT